MCWFRTISSLGAPGVVNIEISSFAVIFRRVKSSASLISLSSRPHDTKTKSFRLIRLKVEMFDPAWMKSSSVDTSHCARG